MPRQIYSKAPITEAVIDLHVTLAADDPLSCISAYAKTAASAFPQQQNLISGEVKVELRNQPETDLVAKSRQQQVGLRLTSEDQRRVALVRTNGFSLSVLAPYASWEDFRSEARKLWSEYRRECPPTSITRAAIRYINRLDIPAEAFAGAESVSLGRYVRIYPEVSDDLAYGAILQGFMQLQIPQPDLGAMLVVNVATPVAPSPGVQIILDFDLFADRVWGADADDDVWHFLDRLHDRMDNVFEASITDATRELIR